MTYNFIGYDQDQQHILSKSVADWVEDDSLEVFVSDVIDSLDEAGRLEPFYPEGRDDGAKELMERKVRTKPGQRSIAIGVRRSNRCSASTSPVAVMSSS